MNRSPTFWINYYSKRFGIDPRAAVAVARGEGGLVNRQGDIGDLAGGGSYGPFQLYAKGALPSQYRGNAGAADAWAWSPQGIQYAIRKMREAGAGGLTGAKAVQAIVRNFERPADPATSIRNALARYGQGGGAPAATGGPAGAAPMQMVVGGGAPTSAARRAFALAMIQQIGQPVNVLPALLAMQSAREAATPAPVPVRSTQQPSYAGAVGNSIELLRQMGLGDAITSGERSVAENRRVGGSPTSYHLPGGPEAYDLNPRDPQFANLIQAARTNPGKFREFFYDPLGWFVKDGKIYKGKIGGHGDHGHVVFK